MNLQAPSGQRTLITIKCTKWWSTKGDGKPMKLRTHQIPTLVQGFAERAHFVAVVSRPRLNKLAPSIPEQLRLWFRVCASQA